LSSIDARAHTPPAVTFGLPVLAAAGLLGNLAAHQLPQLPPDGLHAALVLVLPVLLRFTAARWLAFAVIAFIGTAVAAQAQLERRLPASAGQQDVELAGWIDDFPAVTPDRTVFSLRVADARSAGLPARLRLSWYDAPAGLGAGTSLSVVARLRAPRGLANPGGFDYERWLFVEGIGATGYVRSGSVAAEAPPTLAQRWLRRRAELARRIEQSAPSPAGGALVVALTLGERHRFDDRQWRDLRRTGTSHLVAISGLHVGLIAALSFWLSRAICLRVPRLAGRAFELAALASAATAAMYAALAGFALPTQRALIMVWIALAVVLSRRRSGLFDGLAAALIAVLVLDPSAPLTASFWLSFGAVGLLLLLAGRSTLPPAADRPLAAALRKIGVLAKLQWGITLGLAPFLAAYFAELSVLSPVVNFVAIPFFSFLMVPLCLVAALTVSIDAAGLGFVWLAARLADAVWAVLHAVAALEWSAVPVPQPRPWFAVVAAGAAAAAMPAHPLPGRRLLWLALVPLVATRFERPPVGTADISILDVGHGLAALVETTEHRLLYDAGPVYRSGFDTGGEIVVPVLASHGRAGLDRLVISHADLDHAGGARAVLAAYPAARVLKGPDVTEPAGEVCTAGQRWTWDDVSFEILHPAADFPDRGNDSSCVLKVATRNGAILFAGDIEARGEQALVGSDELRAEIVVVPHHGSATSSSAAFVSAVSPALAIVSAGHQNRWGFPRADVRRRWEVAGAAVVVTGDSGAVRIRLGAPHARVTAERRLRPRYWHAESAPIPGESSNAAL
jgi:competence protein ComEC